LNGNEFTASRTDSQRPERILNFQKRGTASRKEAQLPEKRHSFQKKGTASRKKPLAPRYRAARFTPQQEARSLYAPIASAN
jgi:hypothetical protein